MRACISWFAVNGTLENLIWSKMWKKPSFSDSNSVYFFEFLHCYLKTKNAQLTFAEKPQIKKVWRSKTWISNWNLRSEKGFKGIVVNRALLCLHGGSPEITHTVPLKGLFTLKYTEYESKLLGCTVNFLNESNIKMFPNQNFWKH